ncbi:carcinoembryonic antigen-related cell adhesion molecule 5-like [Gambusia affinis]|uniref:carcinoembryonic antigen-related cell adhesion molecule 5-like n=1 Tax=Gambusia affinis TaxID=33528 RepID=UPI001CDC1F63|nr:carcinoembryonic antigen-related cell adhesion molecule 5-like [Gambusia affinis]
MLRLLFVGVVAFIGLSNGRGVLPDGPLKASVGGTITFTTNLNPPETPFSIVNWQFDPGSTTQLIIISLTTGNTTAPEYEGRITLFRSNGSLELRNLDLSDSGEYRVTIQDGINQKIGDTTLNVYEPVSNVRVSPLSADLIEFNSSVSLFCSSSGSSLSFLWMKDNSQVTASDRVQITTNEENSKLTIVNVTRNDQGSYTCHVSNPVSSDISDPVKISVSYGPDNVQIEVYPSQEHHEIGSGINLTCSADSSPSAEYQWFLNGDKLTSSGPLLRLMNIQMSQSGNYSCQAFNSKTLRYQTSQPSPISVHEPVSNVRVSPLSADLIEFNSSVSLFCSSSGSSLSFLWMKDNSQVTASDRVQITTNEENSNLTIVNVTRNDQGSYTCHVSNPVSSDISDLVKISVSYGPDNVQIEVYPSQEHHEIGSGINLTCSADSSPSAEYQWFLNGDKLSSSGPLLRLMNIQMSQSGNYSCQAFNSKTLRYQTSEPSPISVHERVSNVKVTQDLTHLIEFSGSVSFSCSSNGSSLSFLWMNSSSQITTSDRVQITDAGAKLTIINVTRYDEGPYSCNVSNPVSSAKSDPVNISVSYGPEKVNLETASQKYPEGSNIHLSCSADSRPNATFEWFFNGSLSGSGSELKLINVQKNQSGNYNCRAFNNITSRYQSSQLLPISIEGSSTLSPGAIAGIVIACLVGASLIVLGVYFILKKK